MNTSFRQLEQFLFTGRLSSFFYLQDLTFELQSLTVEEILQLENLRRFPQKHLLFLIAKSWKTIDFELLTQQEKWETLLGSDLFLIEWFQTCYLELLIQVKQLELDFEQFKHSVESFSMYKSFKHRLLSLCPTTLHPIQKEWIAYNQLEQERQNKREIRQYVTLIVGSTNQDLGKKISKDYSLLDKYTQAVLMGDEETIRQIGKELDSGLENISDDNFEDSIREFEQQMIQEKTSISQVNLDEDIDSDFGGIGLYG